MSDREMLENVRSLLTSEQVRGLTGEQVADALAPMLDEHLSRVSYGGVQTTPFGRVRSDPTIPFGVRQ